MIVTSSAVLAVLLGAARADANGLEPPWINELVQDGQNVEITINHTYLDVGYEGPGPGEEELTLVRYSEDDGSLRIVFERELFTRETAGVQCGDWTCVEADEEGCSEAPETCFDCDEDESVECPDGIPCVSNGCRSVEVDDCVAPGAHTYALFSWYDGEYIDCDWADRVDIVVTNVGQDCPAYEDNFECIDLPNSGDDPTPGGRGCTIAPTRTAGATTSVMLLIGLAVLLISRFRRPR